MEIRRKTFTSITKTTTAVPDVVRTAKQASN